VGVLGILFGCLGILGGGQDLLMPKMVKMQKEMMEGFAKAPPQANQNQAPGSTSTNPQDNKATARNAPDPAVFKTMEKMWDFPEWFGTWSIIVGSSKALISAFYLFAAICLLQVKPFAIRLFYWAAGASIALSTLKFAVAISAFSFMGMAMMAGGIFGALIDVVLIIVVATSDKSAFSKANVAVAAG
jgi:hypothetical protein